MDTEAHVRKNTRAPRVMTCRQVEQELRARVSTGRWAQGTMLPGRQDLARELGVGINTLQRALNPLLEDGTLRADNGRGTFVSERTRLEPQAPSRSDWTEATWSANTLTVGIVATVAGDDTELVSRTNHLWQHTIVHAIEQEITSKGGALKFVNLIESDRRVSMRAVTNRLLSEGITAYVGVFPLTNQPEETIASVALLDEAEVPSVMVSSEEIGYSVPHVFYDNRSAGFQAAHHLLRQGWHDLIFLAPYIAPWIETRLEGVREAVSASMQNARLEVMPAEGRLSLAEIQVDSPDGRVPSKDMNVDFIAQGYEAARIFWAQNPTSTPGIIAMNDHAAHGFLRASEEIGRVAGRDYALLGFDDLPNSRLLGMTSLHPPLEAMGREAARMLLQRLRGEPGTMQIRLRSHLIPRTSTHPRPLR